MVYVWASALTLLNAVWLLLVVLGLPGTWLMAASTALLAWWQWDESRSNTDQMFSIYLLIAIVVLAVLGEIVEFMAGTVGAKRAGASRRGAVGALIGGIVGGIGATFLIPILFVGTLIGAVLGAAIGAWTGELSGGREYSAALKSGVGAGVGRLGGTIGKLAIAVVMWVTITVAAFWP
jgi:uncharacterized protein YqgC (DUF456 family)